MVSELTPRSLGTPRVESLTSFARRLAAHEVRSVETLLDVYVKERFRERGERPPNFIATSLNDAVNGSSTLTRVLVDGLGAGLQVVDLDHTTLLSTAGELFVRRDFRAVRAWCPRCLAEDEYDPLLWAFAEVSVCSRHLIRLVTSPRCGHEHAPWSLHASPGGCAMCRCSLTDAVPIDSDLDRLTRAYEEIVDALQRGVLIQRPALVAGVRALLTRDRLTSDALRAATTLSRHTVGALIEGKVAPELGTLARLIAYTGWPLMDLLAHGTAEFDLRERSRGRPRGARRDLTVLERLLREEAPKPRDSRRTLADIAHEAGVSARYPATHFPDLVHPWSDPSTRRRGRKPIAAIRGPVVPQLRESAKKEGSTNVCRGYR